MFAVACNREAFQWVVWSLNRSVSAQSYRAPVIINSALHCVHSDQPKLSHEHLLFRAATSHGALCSCICEWLSSDQCTVCYCLTQSKETWYWDGSNVTEMVMSGVKCTGTEMALTQCQHHKTVNCQRAAAKFAAGVICSESERTKEETCLKMLFSFI